MRVAIISDIHGNLAALDAVLADLRARGPFDAVVNGGDVVFGGPRPREVLDRLEPERYPTVIGNTDQWVAGLAGQPHPVVDWARGRLTAGHLARLGALPMSYRIEPPDGPALVIVHATPTSTTDSVMPDAPPDVLAGMVAQARARALAYGHIHRPYVREVGRDMVVNVGSVGMPFDGDPRSAWAILTLTGGRWRAEIVRTAYDTEAAARDLEDGDHPDAGTFAARVRTGRP